MPTNPNMVAIQTVTVGAGGAATIAFSNIPQTYTDLKVVLSLRVSGSQSGGVNCYWAINGSSSNFTSRWLIGNGSTASSANRADAFTIEVNSAAQTASTFSNGEFYFPNYTSSNFKSYSLDNVVENNGTTANSNLLAGLYSSTSAITSLELVSGSGTFVQYSTATLYGVTSAGTAAKATGGIITMDDNYIYHTFLASGTFTPTQTLSCDYLVIAGGGGGPSDFTAGAGAGGYRSATAQTISTAQTVTVGGGGAAGGANNGSNSSFGSFAATGGGAAGATFAAGNTGGSGAGTGIANTATGAAGNAGNYSPVEGYKGGNGVNTGTPRSTGGGGGAGGAGGNASGVTNGVGGVGGIGSNAHSTWATATGTGVNGYYAGGGGGTGETSGSAGGAGGGGAGGTSSGGAGTSGTANTGGGGGGGGNGGGAHGAGGSGIVIVRYAR